MPIRRSPRRVAKKSMVATGSADGRFWEFFDAGRIEARARELFGDQFEAVMEMILAL